MKFQAFIFLFLVGIACAVGTFNYGIDVNLLEVTDGTEGTPATFADMLVADHAGTAQLFDDTCATGLTLEDQIQPADSLALQLDFVLSGTSAGAGDTLDITGTDFSGAVQTESIDVAAGNGTYNGDNRWATISNIDCTGWADGTLQIVQPRWGIISAPLGAENKVTNGDFSSAGGGGTEIFTGWTNTAAVGSGGGLGVEVQNVDPGEFHDDAAATGGACNLWNEAGGANASIKQDSFLTVGKTYRLSLDMWDNSGELRVSGAGGSPTYSTLNGTGMKVFFFTASDEGIQIKRNGANTDITIDNVSIQEVLPQYTIHTDIDFGDGATSTYFTSLNEMVYFEDGKVPVIKDNSTFEMGDVSGDWSINGSVMSLSLGGSYSIIANGDTNAVFKTYGSTIIRRDVGTNILRFYSGTWIARKLICSSVGVGGAIAIHSGILDWKEVDLLLLRQFMNYITPVNFENVHLHNNWFSYQVFDSHIAPNLKVTEATSTEMYIVGVKTLTLKNPLFTPDVTKMTIDNASGVVIEQYTTNIHVTDKAGADLEGVDIDVTYANLVEGDDDKTYKCIVDFTATDDEFKPYDGSGAWTNKWVLYDSDTVADPLGGDWDNSSFDYKDDEPEFGTGITDADGNMLGENLVIGGIFDNWDDADTPTGWLNTTTTANVEIQQQDPGIFHNGPGTGACNIWTDNGTNVFIRQDSILTIGKIYSIRLDMWDNGGAINMAAYDISIDYLTFNGSGIQAGFFTATHEGIMIRRSTAEATDITIDNISIRLAVPVIQYKKWIGTSEVLEARIHKFTFSKIGKKTFTMDNVIVDHPLVWEIEMPEIGRTQRVIRR